jgi:hypothetical protein
MAGEFRAREGWVGRIKEPSKPASLGCPPKATGTSKQSILRVGKEQSERRLRAGRRGALDSRIEVIRDPRRLQTCVNFPCLGASPLSVAGAVINDPCGFETGGKREGSLLGAALRPRGASSQNAKSLGQRLSSV